jgi:hypothetical protein
MIFRNSKHILSIVFILINLFGCKEKKNTKVIEKNNVVNIDNSNCFTVKEREKILEAIIETPDFQMFLHPEVEGRLPVQLVKNEFVTTDLFMKNNGYKVQFRDSLILPDGMMHRIRVTNIDCEEKRLQYSVFYPVEGAVITGSIYKLDSIWKVEDTNWGIKN